ncbi:glycosyltransferase family 2 protein [Candidatus Saccharibacteria bacterium]|nr:glycosyltransferase family 2 protein [Candidatus Saccharibacteria bacterium]
MRSPNKFKVFLKRSILIPALYTFFTHPFAPRLRRLPAAAPQVPKSPAKVSVVVPNYNYKRYLKRRLLSILRQTYPVFELIILDDASTDGSQSYLEKLLPKLRAQFPGTSIKFLPSAQNSGKSINQWQKAFSLASGDFLWLAEADDLSAPTFLATAMQKFKHPEVVMSFANSVAINRFGSVLTHDFQTRSVDKQRSGHFTKDFVADGREEILRFFAVNCEIPNVSSVIFRLGQKIPFDKYLSEAKKFRQVGDWYFYLQVLRHGQLAYSAAALNFFRLHGSSATAQSQKSAKLLGEVKFIHRLLAEEYPLPEATLAAIDQEEQRLASVLK